MAKYLSQEQKWLGNSPPTPPGDEAYGGRLRMFRATIALDALTVNSTTTVGTGAQTTDTISLGVIPPGYRFVRGYLTANVSLATSTVSIGNATSAAKYRAAAVFTAVDTPTPFGLTAAMVTAAPASGSEEIILTIATAALPSGAGNRLVVDIEITGP